ncbi:MAG: PAS domain-containing protein [Bacteroidetes bacterium]|nr:PAS domain-containing protein [Bacteroidota bacterium]
MSVITLDCSLTVLTQVTNSGLVMSGSAAFLAFVGMAVYCRTKVSALRSRITNDPPPQDEEEKTPSKYNLLLHVYNSKDTCFWGSDLLTNKPIYISPGVENVYGYSQEDLMQDNKKWYEIILEEDRRLFDESYKLLNAGMTADLEFRIVDQQLKIRWLEVRVAPTLDVNGKLIRLDGSTMDITSRKVNEQTLQINKKRLDEAQRIAHIGSWELNHLSGAIFWSDEIYRIFELDPKHFGASYDSFLDLVHPDDKNLVDLAFSDAVRNHTPYDLVHRLLFRDGRIKYVHEQCETTYDKAGNPVLSIGTVQDITVRQITELALAESENRLQTIVRTGPDCIKLTDRDNNLIDMNVAGVEMIEADGLDQIKGQCVLHLVNDPYKEKYKKMTEHIFAGGSGVIDYEITGLKGGSKWLESHSVPMKNKSGEIVSMLCVTHDITARKKAEDEIKKSNEELRQLAAHIEKIREEERLFISREIHDELGQQLTAMKMDATWVSKKLVGADRLVDSKLSSLIQMMDKMVKTVRKISSELRPSELEHLGLRTTLELHGQEFERRTGIKLLFNSDASSPTLCPEINIAIFRIFQESLTNIARHSAATEVHTSLDMVGEDVVLRIKDNGVGFIDSKMLGGKTLGILGMQERALLLGGEYRITGQEGKGTAIEVTIPVKNKNSN